MAPGAQEYRTVGSAHPQLFPVDVQQNILRQVRQSREPAEQLRGITHTFQEEAAEAQHRKAYDPDQLTRVLTRCQGTAAKTGSVRRRSATEVRRDLLGVPRVTVKFWTVREEVSSLTNRGRGSGGRHTPGQSTPTARRKPCHTAFTL